MSELISAGREHNCNYRDSSGPYVTCTAGCIVMCDRSDASGLLSTRPQSGLSFTTDYNMPSSSVEVNGYPRIIGGDRLGSGASHCCELPPLCGTGVKKGWRAITNYRW